MSKYKTKNIYITARPKGWTKNNPFGITKYYRKDNWVIAYYNHLGISIAYFIIDESYEYGYYFTKNKQKFLEEKRRFAYKNTLVWKALHGEYNNE